MAIFILSFILIFLVLFLIISIKDKNTPIKNTFSTIDLSNHFNNNKECRSSYDAYKIEPSWDYFAIDCEPFDIENRFRETIRNCIYRQYAKTIIRAKDDFKVMALPVVNESDMFKVKQFGCIINKKAGCDAEEYNRFRDSLKIFNIINGVVCGTLPFMVKIDTAQNDAFIEFATPQVIDRNRSELYITWFEKR